MILNYTFLRSLADLLLRPSFDGRDLILVLKRHPALAERFEAPMGGVDGLTLERHSLGALETYARHFEAQPLVLLSPSPFKLLLALHDLGKPVAVAEGFPQRQHPHTLQTINEVLGRLAWPEADMDKIRTLIDGDPIGSCLNRKHQIPISDAAASILAAAERLGVNVRAYWEALLIYYQCDIAAYPSLSAKVFKTDNHGAPLYAPDARRFLFRDPEESVRFESLQARALVVQAS